MAGQHKPLIEKPVVDGLGDGVNGRVVHVGHQDRVKLGNLLGCLAARREVVKLIWVVLNIKELRRVVGVLLEPEATRAERNVLVTVGSPQHKGAGVDHVRVVLRDDVRAAGDRRLIE